MMRFSSLFWKYSRMSLKISAWGVHRKTGSPKVLSVMKWWHFTGSNGVEMPSLLSL